MTTKTTTTTTTTTTTSETTTTTAVTTPSTSPPTDAFSEATVHPDPDPFHKDPLLCTDRRTFLKQAGLVAATVLATPLNGPAQAARRASPPNILLLMNDEERHWERIENRVESSRLGHITRPQPGTFRSLTPARRRLRTQGVRFHNYYTPTAPCSPARSAFYTGHHAPDTQVVDNMDFDYQASLNPDIPTMADVLGQAGYYCAYKGKVHLAKDADLDSAQAMYERYGFRDWEGPTRMGDSEGPWAGTLLDGGIADNAAQWLQRTGRTLDRRRQPFFLAVNFINPHDVMLVDIDGSQGNIQQIQGEAPTSYDPNLSVFPLFPVPQRPPYFYWWNPSKPSNFPGVNGYSTTTSGPRPQMLDEWASTLSAVFGNIPLDDTATTTITVYRDNARPSAGTREIIAPLWQVYLNYYLNCVIDNDRAMQTVLDALTAADLQDTTLIVFTSDHGELAMSHMGESRYYQAAATEGYDDPAPLSGATVMPLRQKGPFIYQENNQLPLVFAHLSERPEALVRTYLPTVNIEVPALASCIDMLPTFLTWANRNTEWYQSLYGSTLSSLNMLQELPGVSLATLLRNPRAYRTAKWSDGQQGREWVLLTSDAVSSLDADFTYRMVWQQPCLPFNVAKRGMLRGFYDGEYKFARYFSPQDYTLNEATYAALDYAALTTAGTNGQDVQVFRLTEDAWETYNAAADTEVDIRALNSQLYAAMIRELATLIVVPITVQTALAEACAE